MRTLEIPVGEPLRIELVPSAEGPSQGEKTGVVRIDCDLSTVKVVDRGMSVEGLAWERDCLIAALASSKSASSWKSRFDVDGKEFHDSFRVGVQLHEKVLPITSMLSMRFWESVACPEIERSLDWDCPPGLVTLRTELYCRISQHSKQRPRA
jgi:hypothetical protein